VTDVPFSVAWLRNYTPALTGEAVSLASRWASARGRVTATEAAVGRIGRPTVAVAGMLTATCAGIGCHPEGG